MKAIYINYLSQLETLNKKSSSDKLFGIYYAHSMIFDNFEGISNDFKNRFINDADAYKNLDENILFANNLVLTLKTIIANLQKLETYENEIIPKSEIHTIKHRFKQNATLKTLSSDIEYLEKIKNKVRLPKQSDNKLWGYLDFYDRWAIEPEYDAVFNFINDRAYVIWILDEDGYYVGVVDSKGNKIVKLLNYKLSSKYINYKYLKTDIISSCFWNNKIICKKMVEDGTDYSPGGTYALLDLEGNWGNIYCNEYEIINFENYMNIDSFDNSIGALYEGVTVQKIKKLNLNPLLFTIYGNETNIYDENCNSKLKYPRRLMIDFNTTNFLSGDTLGAMLPLGYFIAIDTEKRLFGLVDWNGRLVVNCEYKFIYTNLGLLTKFGWSAVKLGVKGEAKSEKEFENSSEEELVKKFMGTCNKIDFYKGKAFEKEDFDFEGVDFPIKIIPKLAVSSIFNRMTIEFGWVDGKGFMPKKQSDNKYFNVVV